MSLKTKGVIFVCILEHYETRGLRFEDIHGLGNGNPCLNIEHHKTSASSKAPRPRSVPLTEKAVGIINRQRADHPGIEYVFLNGSGTLYTKSAFLNRFKRLCHRAKVPERPPYALRHAFGSQLAANGTNQAILAQLIGHTNLQTTARYVAHSDKAHREAAEIMERLLD
jgi:integrase